MVVHNFQGYGASFVEFVIILVIRISLKTISFYKRLIRHVRGLKIGSGHNSIILQEFIQTCWRIEDWKWPQFNLSTQYQCQKVLGYQPTNNYCGTNVQALQNFGSFCLTTPIKLVILYIKKKNSFRNMIDHELNLVSSNKSCT